VFLAQTDWSNTVLKDLPLIMPEVWLVLGMCAAILAPFYNREKTVLPIALSAASLFLALVFTVVGLAGDGQDGFRTIFWGSLTIDPFSQFFKVMLIVFSMLVILQWLITSRNSVDAWDVPDFLCLLLGATFGMMLMASANNLLMVFVATESASIPSFALAGFRKKQARSTEGSFKYVLFGAAASAIMVYGMSLIYGTTGTLGLGEVAAAVTAKGISPLLAIGLAAMFAGFAFKLSAVPMHFWCPDVFEGAPTEVTTFLSVASKGAAVVMLVRVLENFAFAAGATEPFYGMASGIGILGAITATWGNLMALHQFNLKRMLAFSSIGHAGYMIMGAACLLLPNSEGVASALLFYIMVYMFMNLGAFTVVALVANRIGSEDLRDYTGLWKRHRFLSVVLLIFLLSLFGMPGLGGFMGKLFLVMAMAKGGAGGFVLIAVLLINTVISLYYYFGKPVKYMVLDSKEDQQPMSPISWPSMSVLVLCGAVLLLTGLAPNFAKTLTEDFSSINPRSATNASTEAPVTLESPAAVISEQNDG